MAFETIETSRRKGEPVTLYLFIAGGAEEDGPLALTYAYTDAEQEITHGAFTYESVPALRDSVTASGTLDKVALSVRLPRDIGFATEYRVWPPAQVTTLIIRQGHLSDTDSPPEFLVVWSGRVLSVGREGDECVVTGEPISSSMRRPGLRRHYQLGCPHVLYSQGEGMCNASEAAGTVLGTVVAVSGIFVQLSPGWNGAAPAVKFIEGMIKWTNADGQIEARKILSVTGDTLAVGGLLRDLTASMIISVIIGCNHLQGAGGDCSDVHNNIQNFGGCPWIPVKNPIGFGQNQYY